MAKELPVEMSAAERCSAKAVEKWLKSIQE